MRPDTPQHYEYVTVDEMKGNTKSFLVCKPWTQFYNKEEREDMPLSQCNNITLSNIHMDCSTFFDVDGSDKYALKDFTYENIDVTDKAKVKAFSVNPVVNLQLKNVTINGEKIEQP